MQTNVPHGHARTLNRSATHRALLQHAAAAALLVLLCACGGGGGGSDGDTVFTPPPPTPSPPETDPVVTETPEVVVPPPPVVVVPPVVPPGPPAVIGADLVDSVIAPTYAAGTSAKGGWDVLMAQRSACGFGLLQQDSRLDAAADNHARYMVQGSLDRNVIVTGHYESSTRDYFTGIAPWDRAAYAGFPDSVSEIISRMWAFNLTSRPAQIVDGEALGALRMRGLIETVYHARGAFLAGRSGGIGSRIGSVASPTSPGWDHQEYALVALVSNEADAQKQKLGTGNLASWPCDGITGVGGSFYPATESPNPFPEITDTATAVGTPVYLKADTGSVLVVDSASLTKVSTGSVLTLRQLNKGNDPANRIEASEVFLVPSVPLERGSTYAVIVTGTLDGVAFNRRFNFSTIP